MPSSKEYRYPLRVPPEESAAVKDLVKSSGHSINDVLLVCIRKGLPLAREVLCQESGRVTNVDPLPDKTWRKIYDPTDEFHGITGDELVKAQIQHEPA